MADLVLSGISTIKKYPIRQFFIENTGDSFTAFYCLSESGWSVEPINRKHYAGGFVTVGYNFTAEIHLPHNDFKSGGIIERLELLEGFNTAAYDPYLTIASGRKRVAIACGSELIGTPDPTPPVQNANTDVLLELSTNGTFTHKIDGKSIMPKLVINYQTTLTNLQDIRIYPSGGSAVKLFQ